MSTQIASLFAEISADTKKFDRGMSGVEKKLKGGKKSMKQMGKDFLSTYGKITAGVLAVGLAVKKGLEFADEGAILVRADQKFDRLAKTIGTTGDALRKDLIKETQGLVSNMELVAGASDFMSLGLVKTHDEAIRLSSVAGQLGMNMNQLVLTLTNQTTMRFDALGVAVDGFDAKVAQLEATGMSASDAFQEAFLQQAEAQLLKVGPAAEQAGADISKLKTRWKNFIDEVKKNSGKSLDKAAGQIEDWLSEQDKRAIVLEQLKQMLDEGTISQERYTRALDTAGQAQIVVNRTTGQTVEIYKFAADASKQLTTEMFHIERRAIANSVAIQILGKEWEDLTRKEQDYVLRSEEFRKETDEATKDVDEFAEGVMGATAEVLNLKSSLGLVYDEFDPEFMNDIVESMMFLTAGGESLVAFQENINAMTTAARDAAAEVGVAISTTPKLDIIDFEAMQRDFNTLVILINAQMGLIDASEAQKQLEALGIPVAEAAALLKDIEASINRLDGKTANVNVYVNYVTGEGGIGTASFQAPVEARAGGGPINMSDVFLVGEQGPEMIIGGKVVPANKTRALLGLGFSPRIQNRLAFGGDLPGGKSFPTVEGAAGSGVVPGFSAGVPGVGGGGGGGGGNGGGNGGLPPVIDTSLTQTQTMTATLTTQLTQKMGEQANMMNTHFERMIGILEEQPTNDSSRSIAREAYSQRGD